jgi:lipopolysaccharide transport system permease protein
MINGTTSTKTEAGVVRGTALRKQHLSPLAVLRHLWAYRELTAQLTVREVLQRYRGSYLGILWSFITPAVLLGVYTFVFSVVLKSRWGQGEETLGEFALTLFAGLIAFNMFSEVVTRSPGIILASPNYVKKIVFPLEVLPVVMVGAALINSLIGLGILLVATYFLLGFVSPTLILLPLAYLPLILLCLSAAWFLASLGVYVRDVGQGVGLMVQILLFISPVFYQITAVPALIRPIMYINPLTTILSGFRRIILWRDMLPWWAWTGWIVLTALMAWLAYVWFMKTKKGFSDVL